MRVVPEAGEQRGQAIQIGALLLFSILIISLSMYQVLVVPNQNAEIEFKHSQQVQEELKTARSLAQRAAATDTELSTSVPLAPQYPSRSLFVNPAPPAGTLETVNRGNIVIRNAEPLDDEAAQAWDQNGDGSETFATKGLVYRPSYNYYDNAPTTVYDASVLYNVQPDGTVRNMTGQTLVSGNRITLVSLSGSMGTTATGSTTIEFQPVSAPTQRVPVEATGGDLTVAIRTRIPEEIWRNRLLAAQFDPPGDGNDEPGKYVKAIGYDPGAAPGDQGVLTLTFESGPDKTYSLRMGQVGVGDNVDDEPATYVTKIDPTTDSLSVTEGNSQVIVVEVRDQFNNPVSGVTVKAQDPPGAGSVTSEDETSNERGRASFIYEGSTTGSETLTFEISPDQTVEPPEKVEYTVSVNSDGSGSGNGGGGADYDLMWESPATTPGSAGVTDCSAVPCAGLPLAVITSPTTDGAPVYFGSSDTSVATLSEGDPTRTDGGRATTRLDRKAPGETTLQAYSGGNRATLGMKVHLRDGFEDGNLGEEWTAIDGNDEVAVVSSVSNSGSNSAEIGDVKSNGGGIVLDGSVDTDGAELVVLEYWAQEGSGSSEPESGEDLTLEYRDDDGNWVAVETLPTDNSPPSVDEQYNRRANITAADAMHPNFAVRFRQAPTSGDDPWYVDDVALSVYGPSGSTAADLGGNTLADSGDVSGGGSTTAADRIEYVDGSAQSTGTDGELRYEFTNTGSSDVTVTDISISDSISNVVKNPGTPGATPEARVTGGSQNGTAARNEGLVTDGTTYDFRPQPIVGGGGTATVELTTFREDEESLEFGSVSDGSAGSADITVTLTFADGSTKSFYFDVSTD